MRFSRPLRDYKGARLCEPCWNGEHFLYSRRGVHRGSNCLGEPCECQCREVLAEKHLRIEPDASRQLGIPLTGAITVTPES